MSLYGDGVYGAGIYDGTVAISATVDSAWPPRLIIEVTGLNLGDVVTVSRIVAGQRTVVRGADTVTVADVAAVFYDGEYPFALPVSYVVAVNGFDDVTTDPVTVTLPGGKVAVTDAITGLACEVVITAWPERTSERQATKFMVGGRTIVVSAPRGGAEQQVELLTETETGRQQMINLLNSATSGIILIRQPGGYHGIDGTYQVLSDTEARAAQSGTLERRLWALDLVDSPGWASSLSDGGWTLGDIETAYDGLTLADLAGDFGQLLDIAVYDWGQAL